MNHVSEGNGVDTYTLSDLSIDRVAARKDIRILGRFTRTYGLSAGDRVSFSGRITQPPEDISGFRYREYLRSRQVYGTVSVDLYRSVTPDHVGLFTRVARVIRSEVLLRIDALYPKDGAQLLKGILIGERVGFSPEVKTLFNRSGLSHIVAVSGSNITIILLFLSIFLRSLPRIMRGVLVAACIGIFALVVGLEPPILRASVFGLIGYWVFMTDRRIRPISTLLLIAVLFILMDPPILTGDVSFQLSFLAVL